VKTIVSSTSIGAFGTGSYTWTPPVRLAAGGGYQVMVFVVGNTSITDTSNATFSLT
jgi:hypothetical protein